MPKLTEEKKFKIAANGYGFEEIPQEAEGIYCDGCMCVHKRPTKMYANQSGTISEIKKRSGRIMCKYAVVRDYWQEEMAEDEVE